MKSLLCLLSLVSAVCLAAPPILDVLNPEFPAVDLSYPPDQADQFAGATGGTPEADYEYYVPTWAKWLAGVGATVLSGWYAIERVDYHEDDGPDSAPAPTLLPPAGTGGGGVSVDRYTVTITGDFVGGPQSTPCGVFAPGLHFAAAAPGVKGGIITAFISSKTCVGGGAVSSSWTPGSEGEIVILCPDEFYLGPARLAGDSILLANGVALRGGRILIEPVALSP